MGADTSAPAPVNRRTRSLLAVSALVAGLLLLAVSEFWTALHPRPRTWSAAQQKRLVELGNQATDLKRQLNVADARPSIFAGENPAEILDRFRKVDAEYNELYQEFIIATRPPSGAPRPFRWAGIALVALGAGIVLASRLSQSKSSRATFD